MNTKDKLSKIGQCLHKMANPMQILVTSTDLMLSLTKEHGIDDLSVSRINNSANDLAECYHECIYIVESMMKDLKETEDGDKE